jgi:type IV secretory pathway TrbL component
LGRTLRTIHETKDIGIDLNAKLDANTHQIEAMYDNLTSIDTTLARSTKVIKRMARKMATDKVIWVFTFLIIAAVVAIIVWRQYKKSQDSSSSDTPPADSTTGGTG